MDLAADALQGSGRDDAFGRTADPIQEVDAGSLLRRGDRAGDVAVGDQSHARAHLPDALDRFLVPISIEDRDGDVLRLQLARLGDVADVVLDGGGDVDGLAALGSGRDLLHVDARAGIEHRASFGNGDDRQRVVFAARRQPCAVDRIDRDVHRRRLSGTDVLAVVEHRRFVLLPLADDDDPVDGDGVEHQAHGVDGGSVRGVLVAAPHPARCRKGGRLRASNEVEGKVPIGDGAFSAWHLGPLLGVRQRHSTMRRAAGLLGAGTAAARASGEARAAKREAVSSALRSRFAARCREAP